MKQVFEAAAKVYENVKKSVQEKWETFKNKFEGTKTEMSQEVLNAKSPEDLIAAGKKLQEQGEALKMEYESVKQEEVNNAHNEASGEVKMQTEAWSDNKQFDENKAAEKTAAEQAEAEEQAAHEAHVKKTELDDQAKMAELRAKLNGESVEGMSVENVETSAQESKENIPSSEYEKLKGTIVYDKNGEATSYLTVSKNNPEMVLEAYKINPSNIKLASEQLMESPDFIKQLDTIRAEKNPTIDYKKSVGQGDWENKNRGVIDSEKLMDELNEKDIEKQKSKAVVRNISGGIQSMEEMGVTPEFTREAIKKILISDLLEGNFGFYGGLSEGLNAEKVNKLLELAGDANGELLKDPEIRQVIVEQAIPRMCNRISADRSSFEYIDKCIADISKTFSITSGEWEIAKAKTFNNSVRDYLSSNGRS